MFHTPWHMRLNTTNMFLSVRLNTTNMFLSVRLNTTNIFLSVKLKTTHLFLSVKQCSGSLYFDFVMESTGDRDDCLFVCWLLNVPATGECISGTDLLRQFYVLPH